MMLIADSGSNKTDWRLVDENTDEAIASLGINPVYLSTPEITSILEDTFQKHKSSKQIKTVHFYGAGCKEVKVKEKMKQALLQIFTNATINVSPDLLAACKATCGNNPGFVAILGTGSNTCFYDGKGISSQVASLGYLLGDEGSGNHLGSAVLRKYLRDGYPQNIEKFIDEKIGISKEDLIPKIYAEKNPNIFFSAIAKLVEPIIDKPEINKTIKDCFREFFTNQVLAHPSQKTQSIHFCGSIGFHYKDMLLEVCQEFNFQLGTVLKKPIDNLVQYHLNN